MNIKQNQTSTLQNNAMAEKVDGRIIEPGPKAEGDTNPNPSQCLTMYFDKAKKVCDLSSTILLVTFPSRGFSSFLCLELFCYADLCRSLLLKRQTDGNRLQLLEATHDECRNLSRDKHTRKRLGG